MTKQIDRFEISDFDSSDKIIRIEERGDPYEGLLLMIDFDDVDQDIIEPKVKRLLKVMNENWEKICGKTA